MSSRELVLGIDVGTGSTRGVLVTPDGEVIGRAQRSHTLSVPRPGWAEHDAESLWWREFVAVSRELAAVGGGEIRCVAVSGIGPCVLVTDDDGQPLRPAILYGIDTRAEREIRELNALYGPQVILERCGSPLTSQAVGPKLLWIRRHEPGVWAKARRWFMASSYLVWKLTGEYVLDHHSASQSDPLYSLGERDFIGAWVQDVAPGIELPRLAWPDEIVGEITPEASEATGLPAGASVTAGTIDAWAEAQSVGVRKPGELMLMYGSTMFLVAMIDRTVTDPRLWCTVGTERDTLSLAGGMATGGIALDWLANLYGSPGHEVLLADAAGVPPGSGGVLVLPYFAGERTPLFDPSARAVICGLTLAHSRAHVYRGLLEGVGYGVRHNLETMAENDVVPSRIAAVGGGTRGGLWVQIVSDIVGRPQETYKEKAGASYGDAQMAARASRLVAPETIWNEVEERVQPNEDTRTYELLFRHYKKMYRATRATAHALAKLQQEAWPGGAPLSTGAHVS